eukprot:8971134-Heterocapsa_arctica.AAC.1
MTKVGVPFAGNVQLQLGRARVSYQVVGLRGQGRGRARGRRGDAGGGAADGHDPRAVRGGE